MTNNADQMCFITLPPPLYPCWTPPHAASRFEEHRIVHSHRKCQGGEPKKMGMVQKMVIQGYTSTGW